MNKFIWPLSLVIMPFIAAAQVSLGPEVGVVLSSYSFSKINSSWNTNIRAGMTGNIMFRRNLGVQLSPSVEIPLQPDQYAISYTNVANVRIPASIHCIFGETSQYLFNGGIGPFVTYHPNGNDYKHEYVTTLAYTRYRTVEMHKYNYGIWAYLGCQFTRGLYFRLSYSSELRGKNDGYMTNRSFAASFMYLFKVTKNHR